jgi:hypothetical protein
MRLAQKIAGIPIALPAWTQVATYIFLALLAVAIGVAIWRAILSQKDRSQLGEIHAKVNIMLLVIRGWQERYESDTQQLTNEHYAPEAPQPTVQGLEGASRIETTDEHERIN